MVDGKVRDFFQSLFEGRVAFLYTNDLFDGKVKEATMVNDEKKGKAEQASGRNVERGGRYGKEPMGVKHVYVAAGEA